MFASPRRVAREAEETLSMVLQGLEGLDSDENEETQGCEDDELNRIEIPVS